MNNKSHSDIVKSLFSTPELANLIPQSAKYRYFPSHNEANNNRLKDEYFYTIHRIKRNGSKGFASGIYRYNASKQSLKATKVVIHKRKKGAMIIAEKLRDNLK
jgi:hypothetical protein